MGQRYNNAQIYDGEAWNQKFSIADAAAAKMKLVLVTKGSDPDGTEQITCTGYYDGGSGAAAITLADYNNFPVGSVIEDFNAFKTHYKTGATTWKSSAAAL